MYRSQARTRTTRGSSIILDPLFVFLDRIQSPQSSLGKQMLVSIKRTIKKLDAHILLLNQRLANLKEERNRQASLLCFIPEEVLANILSHLQRVYLPESIHR